MKGVKSIALEGALNHVVPADSKDQLALQAKGYELTNLVLSKDDKWPVALTSGLGDMKLNAELKGQALTANGREFTRPSSFGGQRWGYQSIDQSTQLCRDGHLSIVSSS